MQSDVNVYGYEFYDESDSQGFMEDMGQMTGRSESAIIDEDEEQMISLHRSRAINQSYINLKKHNLFIEKP